MLQGIEILLCLGSGLPGRGLCVCTGCQGQMKHRMGWQGRFWHCSTAPGPPWSANPGRGQSSPCCGPSPIINPPFQINTHPASPTALAADISWGFFLYYRSPFENCHNSLYYTSQPFFKGLCIYSMYCQEISSIIADFLKKKKPAVMGWRG